MSRPFETIAAKLGMSEEKLIGRIKQFVEDGRIRRFGAVVRHQDLGYVANAMVVWNVPDHRIQEVGPVMASFEEVTHCYQRPRRPIWPYNFYTMVHGQTREECVQAAQRIARATRLKQYRLLFSTAELKKSSMRYFEEKEFVVMQKKYSRSVTLFKEAAQYIPGGVNSPVRAFKSVGLNPVFVSRGEGSNIYDVDGNEYIDYVGSWGPLILGHRHPRVIGALEQCLRETGTSFGAPTEIENTLAAMLVAALPSVEQVRLVNSGTEATMSALRLARGYTGRNKIVKFEGCYHGHADFLLIKAGSGALTLGVPTSPGVPPGSAAYTITSGYNNLEQLREIFRLEGEDIAAIIVEPVAGNMGVVPPAPGFLEGLREITSAYGSLLIFDEVMTGFRVAYGGAQEKYGITPDLTCLGKIIGGGLPVGAYGGRREIMEHVAPAGPVYQAGTLSGNPLAVTAGIATLEVLQQPGVYETLEQSSSELERGLQESAREAGIEVGFNRVGSMLCCFFTDQKVYDYGSACSSNTARFAAFFKSMLEQGVYLAPSQFEAAFVCLAHSREQIERTVEASRAAFRAALAV